MTQPYKEMGSTSSKRLHATTVKLADIEIKFHVNHTIPSEKRKIKKKETQLHNTNPDKKMSKVSKN